MTDVLLVVKIKPMIKPIVIAVVVVLVLLLLAAGSPRGVIAKVLNCGITVSKFEFKSCYYVHFQTIILRKGRNHRILSAIF